MLATGNFPPEPPPSAEPAFLNGPLYRPDPWAPEALSGLDADAPVLLVGTGLTAVDVVVSLLDAGHRGPIHALSRRGLLPRRHGGTGGARAAARVGSLPPTLLELLRALRAEARRAEAAGGSWHSLVDRLRPFTQDVWQSLSPGDKARFLRHLRPWWDVHRHRVAGPVANRIEAARSSGQLRIHAGRIRRLHGTESGAEVTFCRRGDGTPQALRASRVVNCAGPACDFDRIGHPLVRGLLRGGLVRPDPLRLGLDVTGTCALRDRRGAVSRRLFAVGPVTKAAFWEMTAVPDIRRQCEGLAEHLAGVVRATLAV